MRLGIISDTHGLLREEALEQLNGCDAILHAGDIDRAEILEKLREIAPLYAVCGNADEKWAGRPEDQRTPAYAVRGNADEKWAGQRTPVPLYFPERPEGDILPLCADIRLEGIRICMAHKKKDLPRDLTPYQLVVTGHTHKYAQAEEDGVIHGYLFGQIRHAERTTTVMQEGTPYFEAEELYVIPSERNKGTGKALFEYAREQVKNEAEVILLSTATKNWRAVLHFYLENLNLEFWSATLFSRLRGE